MWSKIMKKGFIFRVKLMQDFETVMTAEVLSCPAVCPDTNASSFDKAIWP